MNDSLKYGFSVHFFTDDFFFLIRFPFSTSDSFTYGSVFTAKLNGNILKAASHIIA